MLVQSVGIVNVSVGTGVVGSTVGSVEGLTDVVGSLVG